MRKKPTYGELLQKVKELDRKADKPKTGDSLLLEKSMQLEERVKELNCLYSISRLFEKPEISLEEILQSTVNLIPPAWQHPELTCAQLVLSGAVFKTGNFKKTPWKQSQPITVCGKNSGILEVYYQNIRLEKGKDPFLQEEKNLLEVIADRTGKIIEHKQAEEKLKQREQELEIKTKNLEEVNTALRVLLKKREEDKIELEEKVLFNVRQLILPYLEKLKSSGLDQRQNAYAGIIESNLQDITSPFARRLSSSYFNFTPAEIEVAELVKQGKSTKEIAELLNSSMRAIEFHRQNLRKKLDLKNTKLNLRSRLMSLL